MQRAELVALDAHRAQGRAVLFGFGQQHHHTVFSVCGFGIFELVGQFGREAGIRGMAHAHRLVQVLFIAHQAHAERQRRISQGGCAGGGCALCVHEFAIPLRCGGCNPK